jgi:hypothetical protein
MAAGIIGMSGICQFESITMLSQALNPKDNDNTIISNWGDNITKVSLITINEKYLIGNVIDITSMEDTKVAGGPIQSL